jgi:hypothetical protein
LAQVPDRAWITVVARNDHVLVLAASKAVAAIRGARVLIVAVNGLAYTDSRLTVVADRACVTVQTLALRECLVLAAIRAGAGVHCAVVAVVAGSLVHKPIAVIIYAIAYLYRRLHRRAGTQT